MKYGGQVSGREAEIVLEKEGLRLGSRFLDYAELEAFRPVNHRVWLDTLSGEKIEISMLGFSFDGFCEELAEFFGKRSLDALFIEEPQLMLCEGEYQTPQGSGRGQIALYEDAVCVLPPDSGAIRVPLCFTRELRLDGYLLTLTQQSGRSVTVGRMGYDTLPFAERAQSCADRVKKQRAAALSKIALREPFTHKGLFRTRQPEQFWQAAFGKGVCALELFTGEDAATYLYRFSESREQFLLALEEATEAMGTHREIIYLSDEQLADRPLYRMAVRRCEAVSYLRERSAGRLIHNATHTRRLRDFLGE